jgi:photosystem II stability/assembly factor-like uncharacterized protein
MKWGYLLIVLIICQVLVIHAQPSNWGELKVETDVSFKSVFFTDEKLGWVIGGSYPSIILKINNDGDPLIENQGSFNVSLTSLCFADSLNGWAVGQSGVIIHTTDGGASWNIQTSGTRYHLNSVDFVNPHRGWIVGLFGRILFTNDGGQNWQRQYNGNSINWLNSVSFIDTLTGWIVGDGGKIFKTMDGGVHWFQQYSNSNLDLNAVHFVDVQTGWIVGQNSIILNTTDGGINWSIQQSPITNLTKGNNDLYSVFFTDICTGWAVGRDGIILNTINGGLDWVQEICPTSNNLYSVYFPNRTSGWAVGSFGTVLKYSNSLTRTNESSLISGVPGKIALMQNFPNPFNPLTTIDLNIPKISKVSLKIYNNLGEEVATLVSERLSRGSYSYEWNASNLASGVYLYRLETDGFIETKKMILMK